MRMKLVADRTWCKGWYWLLLLYLASVSFCAALELGSREEADASELPEILIELERRLRNHRSKFTKRYLDQEAEEIPEYSDELVVRIDGGEIAARDLALQHNHLYLRRVRGATDTYILKGILEENADAKNKRAMPHATESLSADPRVVWVERQRIKRRVKRDYLDQSLAQKNADILFNDPYWPKQWPLHDTRTMRDLPKLDLHVIGAWKKGYTGQNVVVSILDDGIQHNHTDLMPNYDAEASYDLNDDDEDPMPRFNDYNKHGTRCAGEVAMVANNHFCGVGIAYNAKIGGIRMLDGKITDRLESEALQFNIEHVDIFSASWGPNDDGKTVEGPGKLAEEALIRGIQHGRDGKGVIYAWASGNGGSFQDDCDCDGYTDSIYTLSISSASQSGNFPWYGEKCASTLATTYSSGAYSDQKITTTDLRNECTTEHTGTSASAPLAAGIVALGLEANPDLTWRDVQHITVWTSEPAPLFHNHGWHKNGIGLYANTRFGFGLMNADAFVTAAKQWHNVPSQAICTTTFPQFIRKEFNSSSAASVEFRTDACEGQRNEVKYLEHLQIVVDIDYTRRGNIAIHLTSPQGTRTKLLSPRRRDNSQMGFRVWPFMSVHTWGEDPKGLWRLEVIDQDSQGDFDSGAIKNISLITYGTKTKPHHYNIQRQYNMNYNKVQDRSARQKKERELQEKARDVGNHILKRMAELGESNEEEAKLHELRINRALDLIDQTLEETGVRSRRYMDRDPHFYPHTVSR